MSTPSVMAVFAHPDDESLSAGGLLARTAGEGGRTAVVTSTWAPDSRRAAELAAALRLLGAGPPRLLGYADARVPDSAKGRPRFCDAPLDDAVCSLVEHIRDFRPDIIVTHDAYGGVTGHPDHLHTHRITVLAAQAAVLEGLYPDAGPPWRARSLYLATHPHSAMESLATLIGTPEDAARRARRPGRHDARRHAVARHEGRRRSWPTGPRCDEERCRDSWPAWRRTPGPSCSARSGTPAGMRPEQGADRWSDDRPAWRARRARAPGLERMTGLWIQPCPAVRTLVRLRCRVRHDWWTMVCSSSTTQMGSWSAPVRTRVKPRDSLPDAGVGGGSPRGGARCRQLVTSRVASGVPRARRCRRRRCSPPRWRQRGCRGGPLVGGCGGVAG